MSSLPGAGHPTPPTSLIPPLIQGGTARSAVGKPGRDARAGTTLGAGAELGVGHTQCDATGGIKGRRNTGQWPEEQQEGPEAGFHTGSANQ